MQPDTRIDVYCMMCHELIETKPGYGVEGDSHGVCDECLAAWVAELGLEPAGEAA